MNTKNPKTLWWWQWLCLLFNKQQHISMVSRQTIAAVRVQVKGELNNRSLACGRCWLLSDWYCIVLAIGCQNNKKYRPITILSNICEYFPVPNTSIVLTLTTRYSYTCAILMAMFHLNHTQPVNRLLLCLYDAQSNDSYIVSSTLSDVFTVTDIEHYYYCIM